MMDQIFIWIADIVPLLATLTSFIYGVKRFFKKGMPIYLQSITMAMACHSLASIYHICQGLTLDTVLEGFTPAYLGKIGFFLFFIAASYGQMDRIIDDGSKAYRPSRIIALAAPVLAILLFVPNLIVEEVQLSTKIAYFLVWMPASISLYFNLKHSIIPDLDFGFVKAIKPYNVLALCLGFAELFTLTSWTYLDTIPLVISSLIFSALCIMTMIAGKKGVEKWTI